LASAFERLKKWKLSQEGRIDDYLERDVVVGDGWVLVTASMVGVE
jgi:hypothetical protein